MNDDLLALKVGMAERRGDIDHRLGRERVRDLIHRHDALEQRQAQREESRIGRTDDRRIQPERRLPGDKGENRQLLLGKPVECLLAKLAKLLAIAIPVARLVGRQRVADDHAVGVTPAHVRLKVVGGDAVFHPADSRLNHPPLARHLIRHLVNPLYRIGHRGGHQLLHRRDHRHLRRPLKDVPGVIREVQSLPIHVSTSPIMPEKTRKPVDFTTTRPRAIVTTRQAGIRPVEQRSQTYGGNNRQDKMTDRTSGATAHPIHHTDGSGDRGVLFPSAPCWTMPRLGAVCR